MARNAFITSKYFRYICVLFLYSVPDFFLFSLCDRFSFSYFPYPVFYFDISCGILFVHCHFHCVSFSGFVELCFPLFGHSRNRIETAPMESVPTFRGINEDGTKKKKKWKEKENLPKMNAIKRQSATLDTICGYIIFGISSVATALAFLFISLPIIERSLKI